MGFTAELVQARANSLQLRFKSRLLFAERPEIQFGGIPAFSCSPSVVQPCRAASKNYQPAQQLRFGQLLVQIPLIRLGPGQERFVLSSPCSQELPPIIHS
jgi:hypothetical protein